MRWFARFGIIGVCLLLWAGLWYGASNVNMDKAAHFDRRSFCFPEFLPGGNMYVWLLSQDDNGNAVLLVQNISDCALSEVKIQFRADGRELCFEAECVLPEQKLYIIDKHKTPFAQWHTVSYISYTAKETENSSLADEEDYSCK